MRLACFFQHKECWFIKKEFIGWFKTNNIRVERHGSSLLLICSSPEDETLLFDRFDIPDEVLVCRHFFCRSELFINIQDKDMTENVFRSGILPNQNGFMGSGVYAVSESEFENDSPFMNKLFQSVHDRQLKEKGVYSGSSLAIFKYTGLCLKCIHGRGKVGFYKLKTSLIPEQSILSVLEETIEYK